MSVIAATITDVNLIGSTDGGIGARKFYHVLCNSATSVTAGDTMAVLTANTSIATITKAGKTLTLRQCAGYKPGLSPGGTAVYGLIATVNGTSLEFSVGGTTAAAAVTAPFTFSLFVSLDES
jgi:hypothetical protein